MRGVAALNIDQLQLRFQLEESPYWWLYNGHRAKEVIGKFRPEAAGYASPEEKMLDSWMQLEELIKTIPHGYGRVVLKKNATDNISSSITHFVSWGKAQNGGASIGSSSTTNINNEAMFERLMTMQQAAHEREMELMTKLLETKHHNENLNAAIEGMGEPSMSEELLRGGLDILKTMVRPTSPAMLGTAGVAEEQPAPPPTGETNRPFSTDQALADIGVIKAKLPGYHPNDVLRALALFCHQQPQEAHQYIGMLIKQVGQ